MNNIVNGLDLWSSWKYDFAMLVSIGLPIVFFRWICVRYPHYTGRVIVLMSGIVIVLIMVGICSVFPMDGLYYAASVGVFSVIVDRLFHRDR